MKNISFVTTTILLILVVIGGCKSPQGTVKKENKTVPDRFLKSTNDTTSVADINWRIFFNDQNLISLIDTALKNNQEFNILLQEIEISKNEVRARKGEYLPFVHAQASADLEKEGRYTRYGAVDEALEIKPGTEFPEPLSNYKIGLTASWEIDIWKKLRTSKKAAAYRYLGSVEGRNFMITKLIAEIADAYYELLALDNQLIILQQNIELQNNAVSVVRQQKEAAKLTQLAVNRFEAQLLNTKNRSFETRQRIVEVENRIRFLTGSFTQAIPRNLSDLYAKDLDSLKSGVPSQLLNNRPDIRKAALDLSAAKLDVRAARANFYPSFSIQSGVGYASYNIGYMIKPESMLYNFAGELLTPIINRNAIRAAFNTANAKQIQQIYRYEQSIVMAYLEVMNQLAKWNNYSQSYEAKSREVDILTQSITISNNLFMSARADYLEVLLTQREALESKMELIEIKQKQLSARIGIYKSLGGGWK